MSLRLVKIVRGKLGDGRAAPTRVREEALGRDFDGRENESFAGYRGAQRRGRAARLGRSVVEQLADLAIRIIRVLVGHADTHPAKEEGQRQSNGTAE